MQMLLQDTLSCEVIGVGGDVICKVRVSHDKTIQSLKSEIAAATGMPVQMQQLIYSGEVVTDEQLCFGDSECSYHSVNMVVLPISSACTTAKEMCDVLCCLTRLGSQALAPRIDDIASLLGRTFDTEHKKILPGKFMFLP